jgi:hypothetical protein
MKKFLSLLLVIVLMLLLVACTNSKDEPITTDNSSSTIVPLETTVLTSSTASTNTTSVPTTTVQTTRSSSFPTDAEISADYEKAMKIYEFFTYSSLERTNDPLIQYNGNDYYKVRDYKSLEALKSYVKTVLSDDLLNALLSKDRYVDTNGALYGWNEEYTGPIPDPTTGLGNDKVVSIQQINDSLFTVTVTVEKLVGDQVASYDTYSFKYEKINGNWVFTTLKYFWDPITVGGVF